MPGRFNRSSGGQHHSGFTDHSLLPKAAAGGNWLRGTVSAYCGVGHGAVKEGPQDEDDSGHSRMRCTSVCRKTLRTIRPNGAEHLPWWRRPGRGAVLSL
jgi:hypothetical protein